MTVRGVCPVCGRDYALRCDGSMRVHRPDPRSTEQCAGSRELPVIGSEHRA